MRKIYFLKKGERKKREKERGRVRECGIKIIANFLQYLYADSSTV